VFTCLLVNDDGIYADGIRALADHMIHHAHVTIVAPDRQQSATSHAITLHKPLHVDEVEQESGAIAYKVNGTPADCVKLALGALCDERPDIAVSGINSGANLGSDVLYSGTAAAAAEAALSGIPALAISLAGPPFCYEASVRVAAHLCEQLRQRGLPQNTYLNVNVPALPYAQLRGYAVTRTGLRAYANAYEKQHDPLGRTFYWMAGKALDVGNGPGTDAHAVAAGYVSITPIHCDFTNSDAVATLQSWDLSL
jgi:5'-nucleotidase